MNKKEASIIINTALGKDKLNPYNKGNVKWSSINSKKDVYWINIHLDSRLSNEYHFILNNEKEKRFTHIIIPSNTLDSNLFKIVFDKSVQLDKIDIELSTDKNNYLVDIKSGGTKQDFTKYISEVFNY